MCPKEWTREQAGAALGVDCSEADFECVAEGVASDARKEDSGRSYAFANAGQATAGIGTPMEPDLLWLALPLGIGYVLLFWVVSLRAPCVPLALIFGLAPFQNDVSGLGWLHFSLSEVHLLLSVPLLVARGWRGHLGWMTPVLWGGLIVTVLLSVPNWRETSTVSLIQMGLYWIGAVAVFSGLPLQHEDLRMSWRLLVLVAMVLATCALATRSSYFWGLNKNGVGASLACGLIVAVECWSGAGRKERRFYLAALPLIAGGLVIVLSRGAWLAAAAGIGFLLAWRGQYRRLLALGLLTLPVAAVVWSVLPAESREYAVGFDQSRFNIKARMLNTDWALEQWRSSPWLGVGAGLRKEYDATNLFWLTLAETGPLGLLALVLVHARCILGVWAQRRERALWEGRPSPVALAGALVLSKFVHGLVDHYWSRGAIMVAWAAVGMAMARFLDSHPIASNRAHVEVNSRHMGRRMAAES